ncbi:MAG TPA: T9SS type A sorting domain-containing protein, partial [Bacteroidia bacterium]|nr:T9SS type A sorting domain-containing protein [Bacteroidia bacterium]
YPVPCTKQVTINGQWTIGDEKIQASIYNLLGEKMLSFPVSYFPLSIDVGDLDAGIYILRITTQNEVICKRIEVLR